MKGIFTPMDNSTHLATETSTVCEELDYELLTDESDWQDWRLTEDGVTKTVAIDLENNLVTVEIFHGNDEPKVYEYSAEDDDTARKVKSKL